MQQVAYCQRLLIKRRYGRGERHIEAGMSAGKGGASGEDGGRQWGRSQPPRRLPCACETREGEAGAIQDPSPTEEGGMGAASQGMGKGAPGDVQLPAAVLPLCTRALPLWALVGLGGYSRHAAGARKPAQILPNTMSRCFTVRASSTHFLCWLCGHSARAGRRLTSQASSPSCVARCGSSPSAWG